MEKRPPAKRVVDAIALTISDPRADSLTLSLGREGLACRRQTQFASECNWSGESKASEREIERRGSHLAQLRAGIGWGGMRRLICSDLEIRSAIRPSVRRVFSGPAETCCSLA